MPCYDERNSPSYIHAENERNSREIRQRLDTATRVACSVLRTLPLDRLEALPKDVQAWWREHQEADRRREAREAAERKVKRARQQAIDKLTPEERKLLGL